MGGANSTSDVTMKEVIKNTMISKMDSQVDNAVQAQCSNEQVIRRSTGCSVEFAKQSCVAHAASNLISEQQMQSNLTQETLASATAKNTAETSGMQILNVSNAQASLVSDRLIDTVLESTQSFLTTCSRNANGTNLQLIEDCENSTAKFAEQTIDISAIGDCAAKTGMESLAGQKTTALLDIEQASKVAGLSGWELVAALAIAAFTLLAALLGIPALIAWVARSFFGSGLFGGQPDGQPPAPGSAQMRRTVMLLSLVALLLLFVYPGVPVASWSAELGISPHEYKRKEGCGQLKELVAPKSMYAYNSAACTPTSNFDTCGILSSVPGCGVATCKDPVYLKDHVAFRKVSNACSTVRFLNKPGQNNVCSPSHVALNIFPTNASNYVKCTRCTEGVSAGFWADGSLGSTGCEALAANMLKRDEAGIAATSCKDTEYAKKYLRVMQYANVCKYINDNAPAALKSTDVLGGGGDLSKQCQPKAENYLTKCVKNAENDYSCTYAEDDACRNDFSACTAPEFQAQRDSYDAVKKKCDDLDELHGRQTVQMMGSVITIVLLLLLFAGYSLYRGLTAEAAAETPPPPPANMQMHFPGGFNPAGFNPAAIGQALGSVRANYNQAAAQRPPLPPPPGLLPPRPTAPPLPPTAPQHTQRGWRPAASAFVPSMQTVHHLIH